MSTFAVIFLCLLWALAVFLFDIAYTARYGHLNRGIVWAALLTGAVLIGAFV